MLHNHPSRFHIATLLRRRGSRFAGPGIGLILLAAAVCWTVGGPAAARSQRGWGYPMYHDPVLPKSALKITLATPAYIHLWELALARPNPIMDVQLCAVINRQRRAGLKLPNRLLDELIQLALGRWKVNGRLSAPQRHAWRMAQIAALRVVGPDVAARQTALLIKLDSRGPAALSLAIDPLLYGNRSGVMRTTWRRRIADIHLPLALRQSAIRALQKDADRAVLSEWVKLCLSRQTPVRLRLAAARALAALHYQRPLPREKGGNVESRALSTRDVIQAILTVGRGNTSEILALCRSHLPVIQLIALRAIEKHTAMCRKLIDVDHGRVAARLLQEHPSSIRHAVTIIARRAAMRRSLPLLFHQLGDPRLYISDAARMALTHLAAIGHLRPLVISDAMHRVTHSAGAQSQMQSLLILGRLKVSPAIKPASQLLTDRSARVVLAAVITLRRLNAVQEGKAVYHLAVKILDHEFELKKQFMKALAKKRVPGVPVPAAEYSIALTGRTLLQSQTLSQAFCLLGAMKYAPAVPLLTRLIPQFGPYATRSREAAIWAIGKIDAGRPDPAIARRLLSRLNDAYNLPPEIDGVRAMSAIALARMGYKPALSSIESFAMIPGAARSTLACIWAARKLAGKIYPVPVNHKRIARGFIIPIGH